MSPEKIIQTKLQDLIRYMDENTSHLSGGYSNINEFQKIVSNGESALPELLLGMDSPQWWRMQAIWTIAINLGKPINFPQGVSGRHHEVRDQILHWAYDNKYIQ